MPMKVRVLMILVREVKRLTFLCQIMGLILVVVVTSRGQSSQVQGGDTEVYDSGEVDGDEVDAHMQNEMEDEDTDGYSAQGDDSDESDGEENVDEVPNPAQWNQDYS